MKFLLGVRKACSGVVCVLLLVCLGISAAHAQPQTSTASSTSSKATGSKTKTSSKKKHHKTTTHSAGKSVPGTSHSVASKSKRSSRRRPRGQQKIDSERAQAIQEALIREHYLTGEPTGTWNQASEDANAGTERAPPVSAAIVLSATTATHGLPNAIPRITSETLAIAHDALVSMVALVPADIRRDS